MSGSKFGDKDPDEHEEQSTKEAPGNPQSPPVAVHEGIGISERLEAREVEEHCSEEWERENEKGS